MMLGDKWMERLGNGFTNVFYLTDAANSGKSMIRVLSENIRVFPTNMLGVSGGYGVQGADGAGGYDSAGPQCLR